MKKLKAYMGFTKDASEEGACLVFAYDVQQAKIMAWPIISDWFSVDYTELRVKKLNELVTNYFQKRYKAIEPMIVENVECCKGNCSQWGNVNHIEADDSGYYCDICYEEKNFKEI